MMGSLNEPAAAKERIDAKALHQDALVFDAHADTALRIRDLRYELGRRHRSRHIDIPRMREGGVDVQGFALWVNPKKYPGPKGMERALALLESVQQQIEKNPGDLAMVRTAAEARSVVGRGKIGIFIGLEGGHAIDSRIENLGRLYDLGVRYVTLTWMNTNDWADSSDDDAKWGGLNELGERIVREMNRLGMLIDLSHSSDDTVRDVLAISKDPVILSHSGSRALCNIPRNISDELLLEVARRGGVVGVNYYYGYLSEEYAQARKTRGEEYREKEKAIRAEYGRDSKEARERIARIRKEHHKDVDRLSNDRADFRMIVDHIDHFVRVAGIDHVGLGSDFDGISLLPEGLRDVSDVGKITEELVRRGYSQEEIRKILGENFMRVFQQVCGE